MPWALSMIWDSRAANRGSVDTCKRQQVSNQQIRKDHSNENEELNLNDNLQIKNKETYGLMPRHCFTL